MKKMGKETGAKAWLNTEELSMSEAQIEPQILAFALWWKHAHRQGKVEWIALQFAAPTQVHGQQ